MGLETSVLINLIIWSLMLYVFGLGWGILRAWKKSRERKE